MEKRVTIKDIAAEAGVSTGTVHRALYGKKGVSPALQEKILAICADRGYQVNMAAAALKRRSLRIVGAFPTPEGKGRFFYSNVWNGFRRGMQELHDHNIEDVQVAYREDQPESQRQVLQACLEQYEGEIDGLVTVDPFSEEGLQEVHSWAERGIPVFLACDDREDCGRIACVQADHQRTGRMAAELLSSQLRPGESILLCCGDVSHPSHAETVQGFEQYLADNAPDIRLEALYGYGDETDLRARLRHALTQRDDIAGAFSVSARLSVLLADEVENLSMQDRVRVVASDLFEETVRNMERGLVRNILYKAPEEQSYLAAKLLGDYVLRGERPASPIQYVRSSLIFRSDLDVYK